MLAANGRSGFRVNQACGLLPVSPLFARNPRPATPGGERNRVITTVVLQLSCYDLGSAVTHIVISRQLKHLVLVLAFCASSPVALSQGAAAAVRSTLFGAPVYITHVTVIDTENGQEHRDSTVVISEGRIAEINDSMRAKPPANAKIVDGSGRFLIPGLWDMHVHSWDYESTYPLYIANGVTGVRDMFGPPDAKRFRAELRTKNLIAPHMYLASPILDGNPPRQPGSIVVNTPAEARKVVDEQKQKGADFLKVYDGLARDVYFAIMDQSSRRHISVAGHVPFAISAWEASAAKQKSIEHLRQVPLACSSREEELWPKVAASKSKAEWAQLMTEANRSYSDEK